jgi:peptide deformylase
MALLKILEHPDPRLRTKAQPVAAFTPQLAQLVADLFETMYASKAIGLAATQVDVHQRLLVSDVSGDQSAPELFINPEIVSRSTPGMVEESCLSVPGIVASVERATKVRVRAVDRSGQVYERDVEDLLAVCLLHELDHLDGQLFIDRLPFLERMRVRQKLKVVGKRRAG